MIPSSLSVQLCSSPHPLSPNSFSLFTLPPPPPSLPMTLHKLRAIQVALVMLIGLAVAYAYPPSRVWALIRAKQSPAHPSCSTVHKYKHSAAYDVVLSLDPLSAGSFNVSNCPWACASQTRRFKVSLVYSQVFPLHSNFKIFSSTQLNFSSSVQLRMHFTYLDNHTLFVVLSQRLAISHLSVFPRITT